MELRTLVEKSRAGDRGAFTSLVRTYQDMAFAYAYAFLNDFQLAEDATQEAFLVVYRNLEKLQVAEAFPGWLRGIVRNGCCHLLRKRPSRLLSLEQVQDITASTPTLEQQMETQETQRLVQVAIQALPLTQREVTTLYYIQEFSQQEIATFLEIPVTTVNMRLHAARTRLKRRLLPMVKETLHANALPDDFAERVGKIVQVQGPVVDAQFPSNALPPIFSAITLSHPDLHQEVTLQVTQHPGNGIARCILVSETPGLVQGMQVVDTGNLGKATFDKSLLH